MIVGVPREVKDNEYRVALTPAGVRELIARGHGVLVETGAGVGSSHSDDDYVAVGATIAPSADDTWRGSDLVVKVKEPVAQEYPRLRPGLVLFTYLHLAADRACTEALLSSGTTSIAYETVQKPDRSLPLLAPMSEVAGRMATQVGARCLEREYGGRGVLLGGVPGVRPAHVVVLGAGIAGTNAALIAQGMEADVTLLDIDVARLRDIDRMYGGGRIHTVASNAHEIENACLAADLVIGSVLVAGAPAPKLVSNELVSRMKPGSVLVDISVDQGGCFADTRPTTHSAPTYRVHESVFYTVANMPGAVPVTSTLALTNVTLPYLLALADKGVARAVADDASLAAGLSTIGGQLVSAPVGEAHDLPVTPLADALAVA